MRLTAKAEGRIHRCLTSPRAVSPCILYALRVEPCQLDLWRSCSVGGVTLHSQRIERASTCRWVPGSQRMWSHWNIYIYICMYVFSPGGGALAPHAQGSLDDHIQPHVHRLYSESASQNKIKPRPSAALLKSFLYAQGYG